jgi:hypothetical protein
VAGVRSRRPSLSADQLAHISLHAWAGNFAEDLTRRPAGRPAAVARLALVAPCRPDIIDGVLDVVEGRVNPSHRDIADWPPRAIVVDLLTAARRVTTGEIALIGPGGIRVEQTRVDRHDGHGPRPALQVLHDGHLIATVRTTDDLTRHLDLNQLQADTGSADH